MWTSWAVSIRLGSLCSRSCSRKGLRLQGSIRTRSSVRRRVLPIFNPSQLSSLILSLSLLAFSHRRTHAVQCVPFLLPSCSQSTIKLTRSFSSLFPQTRSCRASLRSATRRPSTSARGSSSGSLTRRSTTISSGSSSAQSGVTGPGCMTRCVLVHFLCSFPSLALY